MKRYEQLKISHIGICDKKVQEEQYTINAQTTQRSNTRNSYIRLAEYIKTAFPDAQQILDYGAGLGKGAVELENITGMVVETLEPTPKG
jgi:hypothetical protein